MMDNIKMIKSRALDSINLQLHVDILAGGQKVSNTELVLLLTKLKNKKEKVCGNLVIS